MPIDISYGPRDRICEHNYKITVREENISKETIDPKYFYAAFFLVVLILQKY